MRDQAPLEIRCFGCNTLIRKFDGEGAPTVAKTIGTCCAQRFDLPQAACHSLPPEPLE